MVVPITPEDLTLRGTQRLAAGQDGLKDVCTTPADHLVRCISE
jgi:hypothetical protein